MAEEDKKKAPEVEAESASPSSKNPLVTVLLIVNVIVMGFVAYSQFMIHKKAASQPSVRDIVAAEMKLTNLEKGGKEGEGAKAPAGGGGGHGAAAGQESSEAGQGRMFPLDSFVANLAQGDGPRRFVRLNIVLKFTMDSKEEEFKAKKPQIQDSIISILNSKRPEDLLKKEGKVYLKEEIKSAVNSFLVDGQLADVYYVGFQIN